MEDNAKSLELLLARAVEYAKSSCELIKLKAVDKTADAASSIMSHSFVLVFIASFMLFLNLGIALWLGDFLGKSYYGFMIIAGFYGMIGLFMRVFMYKWLKAKAADCFIKKVLK